MTTQDNDITKQDANITPQTQQENESASIPRRHRGETQPQKRFLRLRNWLNIIFMLGAIIGMLTYTFAGQLIGTIIIICAMLFKVVECCLRFMR